MVFSATRAGTTIQGPVSTGNAQVVAVTDKYGKYAAKVASDDVLVFKKSGFTNVSREVNGNKTINLKMQ